AVEMHAAASMRELCRLRVKLNGDGAQRSEGALLDSRQSRALAEQLASDFASVLADLKTTSGVLAERLPELIGDEIFDDQSASLANHRSELIRQVETEQSRRLAWLEQYHDWLLRLPVVDASGGLDGALEAATRMSVLEKSVAMLREENLRLRQLFARDVALLKSELAVAQQAAAAAQPTTSPFDPTIRAFLEDVDIVLRCTSDPAEAHRVLPRTMHLIDELATALRHDATLFLDPASPENVQSTVDAGRLLFTAALDKLRRALRIPLEPPIAHESVSRDYWEALVFERQACRAERHKLRAVAESLALHASRMITGLGSFAKEVEEFVAKHGPDGGTMGGGNATGAGSGGGGMRSVRVVAVGGSSGATAIERLLLSEMDAEPLAAVSGRHGLHPSQKLSTAPLLYAMEKCGAMVETLKDVVDGVIRQVPMVKQARVELPLFFAGGGSGGVVGGDVSAGGVGSDASIAG
ncbi:MAG: hypothetical protein Q8J97_04255, partial [Flavobacteriaceae bacterium]|nr:hypothetical protein [Flavobacteriaceae bacterium]